MVRGRKKEAKATPSDSVEVTVVPVGSPDTTLAEPPALDERILPQGYDAQRSMDYLERYPDVRGSHYGSSLEGAYMHYVQYGKREGRIY